MKDYNPTLEELIERGEILSTEEQKIVDNTDKSEQENLIENIKKFNKVIRKKAKNIREADEQLNQHASLNAGFHDYEQSSFMTKEKLRGLCVLYRVFFEGNPKFRKFLDQMQEYAELDPYSHENYLKETKFVKDFPKRLAEMESLLDKQDDELREEIKQVENSRDINSKDYKEETEEEKKKTDRRLLIKSETLDNRRRALASFNHYFVNMTKGDLSDMDYHYDEAYEVKPNTGENATQVESLQDTIRKFNKQTDGSTLPQQLKLTRVKNKRKLDIYYINASGSKVDARFDLEKTSHNDKEWMRYANKYFREKDMRNEPIFPHEPRMTDINQDSTGNCYLLSGLQNIARLYPQKIRDMIVDNGDGTATVRLYAKEVNQNKIIYHPVYVRVDKTIPQIEGMEVSRLAKDCLWANLIEKAYAVSGLHETLNKNMNIPVNPADSAFKDWTPKISAIEGGNAGAFLETMLGAEGYNEAVRVPSEQEMADYDPDNEYRKYQNEINLDKIKYVNLNNPESVAKHAFYKFYVSEGGTMSETEFMNEDRDSIVKMCHTQLIEIKMFDLKNIPYDIMDSLYDVIRNNSSRILNQRKKNNGIPDPTFQGKTVEGTFKNFKTWVKDIYHLDSQQLLDFGYVLKQFREGFNEANFSPEEQKINPIKNYLFSKISNAIDKGFPVSMGTKEQGEAEMMGAKHAYSIIGAYATDDVPPNYYFRLKNPWTKTPASNGVEYKNEKGILKGKWVNVKDGIFDISLEEMVRDCAGISINGSEMLERTRHRKTEGYDIISDESIKEYNKSQVTADKLTDMVKVANDLYDAMISTDSVFSNDSKEYRELMEGIKDFRHNLAQSAGRDMKDLKKLTKPLIELVKAYEDHTKHSFFGPTSRQVARKKVCSSIRSMVKDLEDGRNPQQQFEKAYAKKLITKYYSMKKLKNTQVIDEVADRLYNNKAFRGISSKLNICAMNKPSNTQMKKHLADIENKLRGRGIDKSIDMATMKQVDKPAMKNVNKPAMGK